MSEDYTVHDCLHTVEEQVRRTDDCTVNKLHCTTETQVEVLGEQHGYNVRSARRTVVREHYAKTGTTQHTSDKNVHELVFACRDDRISLEERLQCTDKH